MWNASEGKLEVQLLDGGGDAALLQKLILLTFCAFGEIALPCSAVIDSRYNAGNAKVLLGREPTGTPAARARLASIKRCKTRVFCDFEAAVGKSRFFVIFSGRSVRI